MGGGKSNNNVPGTTPGILMQQNGAIGDSKYINIRHEVLDQTFNAFASNNGTYQLKDYNWSEFYTQANGTSTSQYNNNFTVPTLRLHAFQPARRNYLESLVPIMALQGTWALSQNALLVKALNYLAPGKYASGIANVTSDKYGEVAKNIAQSLGFGQAFDAIKAAGLDAVQNTAQQFIQNAFLTNQVRADAGIDAGIEYLQALFKTGMWLQSYEIPFFSDVYQKADGNSGWSTGGIESIGESTSKMGKFLSDGFNVNIPLQPTWNKPISKEENDSISTTFYLINNSIANFRKNYQFMNSLMAHCYWAQLDYYMQSPNVFRAAVPGRFNYLWATLQMDVKVEGKERPIDPQTNTNIPNVNMIPDAYKITLTINSLCPNNYNLFLNFLRTRSATTSDINSTAQYGLWQNSNAASFSAGTAGRIAVDLASSTGSAVVGEAETIKNDVVSLFEKMTGWGK